MTATTGDQRQTVFTGNPSQGQPNGPVFRHIILFEFVDYPDEGAFNAFKATPAHQAFANFTRNHADWVIADYTVAV